MKKRFHIVVHGRVQGVGFRYYTQQQASHHNIVGWVRNNPDETVEMDIQGEFPEAESFISAIEKGSPYSYVEKVDRKEMADLKDYNSFHITH
ncbi:acylphosphatase [Pseudalkalibacillus caeni]|uniref:acylphosphatase n=1 Tax=Exobacillus caeni TaxID=2574798 RepID=UPI001FE34352|nr:acylphosphatase [Pseudalkalibacillus caeni]